MTRHHRSLLFTALLLSTGLSASCSERLTERDPEDPRIRCALLITYIEEPGGQRFRLHSSETGLSHDQWCTCTTHEEFLDPDYRLMINDLAYEACVDFVAREGNDLAYSTCLESHEASEWAEAFGFGSS